MLRKNNLSFPQQHRPPDEDIQCWRHFIHSISKGGKVHLPLGRWIWLPDQQFDFMIENKTDTVYKRRGTFWYTYRKKHPTSRRYLKSSLRVETILSHSRPVQVIALSQYILIPSGNKDEQELLQQVSETTVTNGERAQNQVIMANTS